MRLARKAPGKFAYVEEVPNGRSPSIDSLFQAHRDRLAGFLADSLPDFCFHGQHVCSITHRHERAGERMTIDSALNFDEAARAKEFDGLGPRHVSPSTLPRTFLEPGRELSLQHICKYYRSCGLAVMQRNATQGCSESWRTGEASPYSQGTCGVVGPDATG